MIVGNTHDDRYWLVRSYHRLSASRMMVEKRKNKILKKHEALLLYGSRKSRSLRSQGMTKLIRQPSIASLLSIMFCLGSLLENRIVVFAWSTSTRSRRAKLQGHTWPDCCYGLSQHSSRTITPSTQDKTIRRTIVTRSSLLGWKKTTSPLFIRRLSPLFLSSSTENSAGTSSASLINEAIAQAKRRLPEVRDLYERNLSAIPPNLSQILEDFETESSDPSFWDADKKQRNSFVTSQISYYSRMESRVTSWKSNMGDAEAALEMLLQSSTSDDENDSQNDELFSVEERQLLLEELETALDALEEDGERFQLELLLSGPYDDQPCRMVLTAGAGGTEANDWVADLRRMYERHAQKLGFSVTVEDEQPGDVVGYKTVELVIHGSPERPHAYGWFQGEKGAHRLVRLSPFNANNKRQTTFAGVDVAPILMNEDDLKEIDIPDKDLEITTMRSGGAGGQNVNKVNSAVRIKHLPSGLNVKCTQERSQAMNKDLAMKRLKAQLLAIAKEQLVEEIQEIRGDQVEASWGAQIRNYVLHPYKMIKDQRSGWETANVQNFLDGDLEECISSVLRHRADEQREAQKENSG